MVGIWLVTKGVIVVGMRGGFAIEPSVWPTTLQSNLKTELGPRLRMCGVTATLVEDVNNRLEAMSICGVTAVWRKVTARSASGVKVTDG